MGRYITTKVKDFSVLDETTGELLELRQTKKLSLDEFFMVFASSCPKLMQLKGLQLKVLICCWRYSTYNKECSTEGNIIHNSVSFKEYCRKDGLDTSDACIDRAFTQLCKEGLLIRKSRGEYILNPQYFFKGTLSDRTKIIYNIVVEPKKRKRQEDIAELDKLFQQQLAERSK